MQRITALWNRGWMGKAVVGTLALMLGCCVIGVFASRTSGPVATGSAPAAQQATVAPAAMAETAAPTAKSAPTAPDPTAVPPTVTPQPPTPEPTKEALPVVGDQVDVEQIVWKIEEAKDIGDRIESNNQFIDPVTTAGKFIRVRLTIQNQGKDQERIAASSLELVDAKGITYRASSDLKVAMLIGDNTCGFQELPAGVPKGCDVVFEVPKDASGFKFRATNLALVLVKEKFIDLGL